MIQYQENSSTGDGVMTLGSYVLWGIFDITNLMDLSGEERVGVNRPIRLRVGVFGVRQGTVSGRDVRP